MTIGKLGYWNIRGLAAPIRMLLHYCDIPFTEVRYELSDAPELSAAAWLDAKRSLGLELPNLPYYIDDGGKFVQSLAIMRYIAARHGSNWGSGSVQNEAYVDMMAHAAMDLRNAYVRCCYGSRSMEEVNNGLTLQVKPQLLVWNEHMASGRRFCAGDRLSYADFFLAEHIDQIRLTLPHALQGCTALSAYTDRFFALEKNQAFACTSSYMKWPVNNKSAFVGAKEPSASSSVLNSVHKDVVV